MWILEEEAETPQIHQKYQNKVVSGFKTPLCLFP